MTPNCVKLGRRVTFMKHLAGVVSLIFLAKTLIWNKITLLASNMLNIAGLIEDKSLKSTTINFANIPISIRFITA